MHGPTNIEYQKSRYYLVNTANFGAQFSHCVCLFYLSVSGDYVSIIGRKNHVFATLGTCYSETSG